MEFFNMNWVLPINDFKMMMLFICVAIIVVVGVGITNKDKEAKKVCLISLPIIIVMIIVFSGVVFFSESNSNKMRHIANGSYEILEMGKIKKSEISNDSEVIDISYSDSDGVVQSITCEVEENVKVKSS